jgi:NADH-quinone oxidoreductase subunit I
MNYLQGALYNLGRTLKGFLTPRVTVPIRRSNVRPERYRASFALVHDENGDEACIGCGICEQVCPSGVIAVVAGEKKVSEKTGKKRGTMQEFTLNLQACLFCELCIQVCPTDSIVPVREQEEPSFSREDLVLTRERLFANETGQPRGWATGTKLQAMQEPPPRECASKKSEGGPA